MGDIGIILLLAVIAWVLDDIRDTLKNPTPHSGEE
jgi:hypothetical protein